MSELYILDCSGLAYWLWHRGNQDLTEHGEPCGMLYALREWCFEFLERQRPSHIVAALDGGNNWRKKTFAEYKAGRPPIDERLKIQLNKIRGEFEALGIRCIRHDEFEADDVAATLVNQFASPELPVTLVTSDKDWAQLISEHVRLFDPRPDKVDGTTHIYDAHAWQAKSGVPPHRMAEFLAMTGDASDGVPGVEGWGKVKAVNAITQTKSWPEIVRKARAGLLQKITTKNQAALVAQLAEYQLAHELVSLRYDVPITETIDDLEWRSDFGNPAEPCAEDQAAKLGTTSAPESVAS